MKIYYDGDCYFCTNFVKLLRLRQAVGEVQLISLRDGGDDATRVLASGLAVNTGFVVEHEGVTYHGARAFHYLNTLLEPRNLLSRLLFWLGGAEDRARFLYPLMVFGRYLVLILQGGALIGPRGVRGRETLGPRLIRVALLGLTIAGGVRLLLHGSFPLATVFIVSVSALTTASAALWTAFFLRADYAQRTYARIRAANWIVVVSYVGGWLLTVNAMDMISIRRIVGFLVVLPLLGVAIDLYRANAARPEVGRVPAAVPVVILVFAFFPGLYLAPFYGGIAGWTLIIDKTEPISIGGFKLVNDAGEEVWYNHAFFQPVTQNGRMQRAFLAGGVNDENYTRFMDFMLDNYVRIYPMLEKGRMPNEWALGKFAYPSHNLSDSNALDYVGRFAPERIVGIRAVTEYYSRDDKLLSVENGAIYPLKKG